MVTKEMYDFVDKGGRHISLRPELTASVCRAFAQHRPHRAVEGLVRRARTSATRSRSAAATASSTRSVSRCSASTTPHLDVEVDRPGVGVLPSPRAASGRPDRQQPRRTRRPCRATSRRLRTYFAGRRRRPQRAEPGHARHGTRCGCSTRSASPTTPIDRRGADDRRLPVRRRGRPLRDGAGGLARARTSRSPSNPSSFAGSTTTAAPPSSSRAARSTRPRTRSVAAAATTAWSRRSAVRRRPVIGFALGRRPHAARLRRRGRVRRRRPLRSTRSSSTWSAAQQRRRDHRRAPCGRLLTADRGYDNRSMKAQMKLANRSGAACGGDRRRRRARRRHRRRAAAAQRLRSGRRSPRGDLINSLTSQPTGTDR